MSRHNKLTRTDAAAAPDSRPAPAPALATAPAPASATNPAVGDGPAAASVLCGAGLGLLAALIASGAAGVMTHPLRHGLSAVLLVGAGLLAWPRRRLPLTHWLLILLTAVLVTAMSGSPLATVTVLGVALALTAMGWLHEGASRKLLQLAGEACVVLALYRLACTSIPWAWMAADAIAQGFGHAAGALTRLPLHTGTTFAALDALVPVVYLALAVPARSGNLRRQRWLREAGTALAAALACQFAYLVFLCYAPSLLSQHWLQIPPVEAPIAGATPPPPGLVSWLRLMIPWNLPLLALLLQTIVAAAILRQTRFHRVHGHRQRARQAGVAVVLLGLAAVAPALTYLCRNVPDLHGKKIVISEKGFLNWLKPEHGQYGRLTIGMYGLMPTFLESLGAQPLVSPDLSEQDLAGASAVVLLFPNDPWPAGQKERLWAFVRAGGTLLVMGEHTTWEKDERGQLLAAVPGTEFNRFNEILAPSAMRVNFDSATFTVGGWLHSYEHLAHPIAAGIGDQSNEFGSVIGASLDVHWPARPFLIGRWGWADPGDTASTRAMMGNGEYDPGERLGDVVLAAEQRLGKGRIIAFGDTSALTNGLTVGCHPYTSRLFTYLFAQELALPGWRLALGLAAIVALGGLLVTRANSWLTAATTVCLATSLTVCTAVTAAAWERFPEGRTKPDGTPRVPNNLAYIDASHLGAFSAESWRPEGLGGLAMTMMRNGYLTLNLDDFDARRLERAKLFVCVAPSRPFSHRQRDTITAFVRQGGVLIMTVGYEEREASRALLRDLGFAIGLTPEAEKAGVEPRPLGHFKAPFFTGDNFMAYVRFHAAWPVICNDPNRLVISRYPSGEELIVMRRVGQGLVVVVGDTFFAVNKNLEHEGGEPFDGLRENAVFWRWLLALLREGMGEGKPWHPAAEECTPATPPSPPAAEPQAATDAATDAAAGTPAPSPNQPEGAP